MRKLLAGLIVLGCHAPPGAPRAPSVAAPSVTLCRTTEAELRSALGEPSRDGVYHDARVMSWILGEQGGLVRYLAVLLDEHQVVVDRVWNIPSEISWTPTSQCAGSTK